MENVLKTINTDLLEVAYLEYGPADGKPVILLHGWPYGPATWNKVALPLADAGWHVYVPTLRGFGQTHFLDDSTVRSGQYTAIAQDCINFADALGIAKFTLVGHDWGGTATYYVAAFWPERVDRIVALSVPYKASSSITASPTEQMRAYWYQWLLQTDQAPVVFKHKGRDICRELWRTWMAPGKFDETEFDETAVDWTNPDWVDVTISAYRFRYRNDAGDSRYDTLESKRLATPKITVPTTVLHGDLDGASLVGSSEGQESYFGDEYKRIVVRGVGHFIQSEQPQAVIDAVGRPK